MKPVESRPERERSAIEIPLATEDDWIHRVDLGGGCFLAVFRRLSVLVVGFTPANGTARLLPVHYPVEEIYRSIRGSKPDNVSADACFVAIGLLKATVHKEER